MNLFRKMQSRKRVVKLGRAPNEVSVGRRYLVSIDLVFYWEQIADELGIMIWHDMMFACSMYPADDAFLDNVAVEIRQQVSALVGGVFRLAFDGGMFLFVCFFFCRSDRCVGCSVDRR